MAEDIVDEVFIKIWERRRNFSTNGSFNSLVFTIARNLIIDTLRKQSREELLKRQIQYHTDIVLRNTENDIMFADYMQHLEQAIQQLSPKCQVIFKLRHQSYMTYAEIAESQGVSEKTVQGHISRALRVIRDYFLIHADVAMMFFLAIVVSPI